MLNYDALMKRITVVIMATFLSIDGIVDLEASAQNRRRGRDGTMPLQQRKDTLKADITKDLPQNLLNFARLMSDQTENRMVDLVFVIDGGRGMLNAIAQIQRTLVDVANVFEEELIDYRIAATSYGRTVGEPRIATRSFETDLAGIQSWLRELRMSRNSETGYGLDAILQTLKETGFRSEALKHLIVFTDSRLQTAWAAEKAKDKMLKEIVDLCKKADIHINIIGVSESAQIQLTARTGGEFCAISGDGNERIKFLKPGDIDKSMLKIEGVFKLTAQHIVQTVKKSTDVIFMFDSSLRMAAKVDKTKVAKICHGIEDMADILNKAGIDYRFGAIRYW
ncbi:MAG: VWA domain-containing protein, partial [Candidatus Poribacteria bacterium]|nr:VWA domain-containing protein [Candidatus Poribacteria bacterium]